MTVGTMNTLFALSPIQVATPSKLGQDGFPTPLPKITASKEA